MAVRIARTIDWTLILALIPILFAGLLSMKSFGASPDYFFWRQLIWITVGICVFLIVSRISWQMFTLSGFLLTFYFGGIAILLLLLVSSQTSWFSFSFFSIQPSEMMKVITVLLLAKYFSRRHIEIRRLRHIFISGVYAAVPAFLVLLQPDFGSAIIFFALWLGMVLASGIPFRYLAGVFCGIAVFAVGVWMLVLAPYQQARVTTFLNPYIDPQGTGYHTLQAKIAVGSGGLFGQGIGYGSQSRLQFLPEHETDFIFAAFAEEWGFAGALILAAFFLIVLWRILFLARSSEYNFIRLFAIGFSLIIIIHFIIHVGMNIGLLPITGLPLSFVSYGGSHLITLFFALGIWMNMYGQMRVRTGEEIESA